MNFVDERIVFQEVPNEISLCYVISGCPVRCDGCHSSDTWKATAGSPLTLSYFEEQLEKYQSFITCVVFLGGEWDELLPELLVTTKVHELKTCLYTGLDDVSLSIKQHLDYIKVGPWVNELGGLDSPTTNQRFIHVPTNKNLTHNFIR